MLFFFVKFVIIRLFFRLFAVSRQHFIVLRIWEYIWRYVRSSVFLAKAAASLYNTVGGESRTHKSMEPIVSSKRQRQCVWDNDAQAQFKSVYLLCFCLQVFIGRAVVVLLKSSCDQFDFKNLLTKAKLKENDATVRLRVFLLVYPTWCVCSQDLWPTNPQSDLNT